MAFAGIFGLNKDDMFDSQNQYEINLSELGENEIPKQLVKSTEYHGHYLQQSIELKQTLDRI